MNKARFEGLTRVVVEMEAAPGTLGREDIVIDNILCAGSKQTGSYWSVPISGIKDVSVSGSSVIVSLSCGAFLGKGGLRGKMAKNACITVKGAEPLAIVRQGAAISDVHCKILDPDTNLVEGDVNCGNSGRGITYWLNMGNGTGNPYRIDHGADPAHWLNGGCRYSLVGMECNVLLIVFDFPDAKGADNSGVTALPGEVPVDNRNFVDGKRLKKAIDYYNWVGSRNIRFMDEASFGNVKTTWTLLENSEPGSDGIYTLPYSLYPNSYYEPGGLIFETDRAAGKPLDYPWLETNPSGWNGYFFARGGSTDNWNSGVKGYSCVPGLRRDFDALLAKLPSDMLSGGKSNFTMGYWAAVENAPGITYGQSFSGNGNIGPVLGLGGTKEEATGENGPALLNFSFMGADSYGAFKYRHMTHELGHQMGLPDHYIDGRTGFIDPYTGISDTFPLTGGFDHMGQITGISPDFWAWVKWKFGWFRDDQIVAITGNGRYDVELTPIETESGTKLIIVPGEIRGVVYCVEYRGGKLGVDNIAQTELSNDPFDPDLSKYGEQARWDHSKHFGTDTMPGVLLYRINANASNIYSGHTVTVDILPRSLDNSEGYNRRYSETLNNSLLGRASGVYSYTDAAFGITVSVNPVCAPEKDAADAPCAVTVLKSSPSVKDRTPVLSNAQFIDMNTIQFTFDKDLRGLHPENFRVIRNGVAITGSKLDAHTEMGINQLTSFYARLTFPGNPFTLKDVQGTSGALITVEVIPGPAPGTLYQYLPSASLKVSPKPGGVDVGTVTLSRVRFCSLAIITAYADKDLSGFASPAAGYGLSASGVAKSSLKITKPGGLSVLAPEQIISASYNRETRLLTIQIAPDVFKSLSDTIGTAVEIITPVSSYSPAVSKPACPKSAGWHHNVEMNKTERPAISRMASLEGAFNKMINAETEGQCAVFKITGGSVASPVKTRLNVSINGGTLTAESLFVIERPGGIVLKTKLGDWLASFAQTHKYNGIDEFPMNGKDLELQLAVPEGSSGHYSYNVSLISPACETVWAAVSGMFEIRV